MNTKLATVFGVVTLQLVSVAFASEKLPQGKTGTWVSMATMTEARAGACAARLADGRVLITGGLGPAGALSSAEMFGAGGSFASVAPMSVARGKHTCVLVTGGSLDDARAEAAVALLRGDGLLVLAGGRDHTGTCSPLLRCNNSSLRFGKPAKSEFSDRLWRLT